MRRSESQRMRFILQVYGSGFGFCSVPGSGSSLVRKTGRGLANWILKEGVHSSQKPAGTVLSPSLGTPLLTAPREIPEQKTEHIPLARWERNVSLIKDNQRLSSCRTLATHTMKPQGQYNHT